MELVSRYGHDRSSINLAKTMDLPICKTSVSALTTTYDDVVIDGTSKVGNRLLFADKLPIKI